MAGPIHLKVFLSSPGDVQDERQAIVRLIKDKLPYDPLQRGRVTFDVLAWDDKAQRVALLAGRSGQASVDQALGVPADCDLTVVIVRTRLGTPLGDRPPRPDGRLWRSGTEWELWNALDAEREVVICRGPGSGEIDPGDHVKAEEQLDQARLADEFFSELAAQKIPINRYQHVDELTSLVEQKIKRLARERIDGSVSSTASSCPKLAIDNLPPPNPDFVGREGVLAELRRLLLAGQGLAVLTQAITGLGGFGKTQTARAYAHRHLADYKLIWWLRAETAATLAPDYAGLAGPLGLDPSTPDQTKLVADIRQKLQSMPGWLLIFDNVEDPTLLREWLPGTGGGHALITSRRTDWRGLAKALSLELMPANEALHLLTGLADPQSLASAELTAARELATELGRLPLAMAQARTYMVESGKSLAGYLRLFRASRPADFAPDTPGADYPASYATTWHISIGAAAAACPAAGLLLELLAFLAPDPLPIKVLGADPAALPEGLRSEHLRDDAIAALRRYSMIEAESDQITVHRLVQAVTRDQLDDSAKQHCAMAALHLIKKSLPRPARKHTNWPAYAALLPHALASAGWAEQYGVVTKAVATVLHQLALYHKARADWGAAESLMQRAIGIIEEMLGPSHLELAPSLNGLAGLYWSTGRYAAAEPLFLRAIAIGKKALGPAHPDVAIWLNNFGNLLHDTDRHAEAKPLFLRAIAIGKRALGPADPHFGTWLNNLANLFRVTGRFTEAEPLFLHAITIAIGDKTLGPNHTDLATWLNNLGKLYQAMGRHAEAEPLFRRAIAIDENAYGPDHHEVAADVHNLGWLYFVMRRYVQAEPLLRRAVEIGEKTFLPDHPKLFTWRNSLASLYRAAGR